MLKNYKNKPTIKASSLIAMHQARKFGFMANILE